MNEATEPCLEARGLRKRYPNGVEAVRDLSLSVRRGEVLGLAGPNGAGKSTLLKLLAGLLRPESGAVVAEGADVTGSPERAALHVALMPDPLGVYTDVSSREYLEFFGRVFGLRGPALSRRVAEVAEELGLGPWLEAEVETLSAGWQRRLALGRTLLSDAPVLLLDEPAAGLDVGARADLLALVRRLASSGRTLVVSSHILPELQDLADRFAVMVQGRWAQVAPGKDFFTREELRRGFSGGAPRELRLAGGPEAVAAARAALLAASPGCLAPDAEPDGGGGPPRLFVRAADEAEAARLFTALVRAGVPVAEWRAVETGLEETVLRVLRGGAA